MDCKKCKYYIKGDNEKFFKCSWKPDHHNYMPPCQIELLCDECDEDDELDND